ncbi:MAG: T9SS type A sorting domain-containing protein [Cyclobacteriaceae bacterium]
MKKFKVIFLIAIIQLTGTELLAQACAFGNDVTGNTTVTSSCTVTGDLAITGGTLTINSGVIVTVTGNLTNGVNKDVTILGTLDVDGTYTNSGNGDVTVNGGTLAVGDSAGVGGFSNESNGIITVTGDGSLYTSGDFYNGGNGTTNFLSGTIKIEGNFTNDGNGTISADGTVQVGGDFTVNGNGSLDVEGGLLVDGDLTSSGNGGISVGDGGVLVADSIGSNGDIDVANGGTLYAPSGVDSNGTITVDPGNGDTDCTNNCCGSLCGDSGAGTGDTLGSEGYETLPVLLATFNAWVEQSNIVVSWVTSAEINFKEFELYKNVNGEQQLVSIIPSYGNSNGGAYTWIDESPVLGNNIYQIKSVDYDGYTEWFPAVLAQYKPDGVSFDFYPNPSNYASIKTDIYDDFQLEVLSLDGRRILVTTVENRDLSHLGQLVNGIYLFRINVNGLIQTQRVVISN